MQQMRIEIHRRHYISCNKNLRKNEMIRRKKERENGKIRHTDLSAFQQFFGYPKKRNLNTGHIAFRTGRSGIQLLAAACSGVLLLVFRKSRKTEIPLVPFLLLGYVGGMVI